MIALGEIYGEKEGVNNTIVYAKGTVAKPVITRVVKIDLKDETRLSMARSDLYAFERCGIRQETSGVFTAYDKDNF